MKYKILTSNALMTLELQVNEYIEKSYLPCGSIFSYDDRNCGRCIFQPMLKRNFLSRFFNKITSRIKKRRKK